MAEDGSAEVGEPVRRERVRRLAQLVREVGLLVLVGLPGGMEAVCGPLDEPDLFARRLARQVPPPDLPKGVQADLSSVQPVVKLYVDPLVWKLRLRCIVYCSSKAHWARPRIASILPIPFTKTLDLSLS